MNVTVQPNARQPGHKFSQADIDHNELDSTAISPAVAKFLSWSFVVLLAIVPVSQTVVEVVRDHRVQVFDVFLPLKDGIAKAAAGDWADAGKIWKAGLERSSLRAYEQKLERSSLSKSFFQPRVQEFLTKYGGFGNDKAIAARDGWLYYQPGWSYVVGPEILDRNRIALTAKKMVDKGEDSAPQPDPRPALFSLSGKLSQGRHPPDRSADPG
jgi:hypothetical protein